MLQILMMKNIYIICICLFIYSNSYLILPLKYFPVYKYNYSTPSEIMQTIVATKVYSTIEIGTPKKSVEIPLDFSSSDFYISDYPIEKFAEKEELFSDLKFYNSDQTSSRIPVEDIYFQGDNFEFGEYSKESFYFNNTKYELGFYYPFKLNYPESGGIGFLLFSSSQATSDEERTFFKQIKDKNLINNYYWSIFYNSKEITKEEEGFLFLGLLPDESGSDLGYYKKKDFNSENLESLKAEIERNILLNKFKIDEIIVYEGNNKSKIINDFPINNTDIKNLELNYHSRGVQVPYIFLEKYDKIFEEYISKGECFKDEFNYIQKKYFFYCKNNKETIKNIKNVFPGFKFIKKELNYSFYLDADDLFYRKDDYVFCLLYFHYNEYIEKNWIMGKPFLKKYQFSFGPDKKLIYFYSNKDEKQEKEKKQEQEQEQGQEKDSKEKKYIYISIILVLLAIVIVSFICFILFKYYLYDKFYRKKKANELDDDYDYIQQKDNDNNPNDNLGINRNDE